MKTHGWLDYILSTLLLISPWVLQFNYGQAETWVPVIAGLAGIGYSLFTNYQLAAWRRIPVLTHLLLDLVNGIIVAASPWLFGFAEKTWVPFFVLGIARIIIVLFSDSRRISANSGHLHHHTAGNP